MSQSTILINYCPKALELKLGDIFGKQKIFEINDEEIITTLPTGELITYSRITGECLSDKKRPFPGISKFPKNLVINVNSEKRRHAFLEESNQKNLNTWKEILKEAGKTFPHGIVKIKEEFREDSVGKVTTRINLVRKPYLKTFSNCTSIELYSEGHYFIHYFNTTESTGEIHSMAKRHVCNEKKNYSSKHSVSFIASIFLGKDKTFTIEPPSEEEVNDFLENDYNGE